MSEWYLVHRYVLGPDAGTDDHVGPFRNRESAKQHKRNYGPVRASIEQITTRPSPLMSPEEHIAYLESRM